MRGLFRLGVVIAFATVSSVASAQNNDLLRFSCESLPETLQPSFELEDCDIDDVAVRDDTFLDEDSCSCPDGFVLVDRGALPGATPPVQLPTPG